ncbi:MAG: hypothetical protein F6K00_21390 [Leptolyngbya sp. SIOISBB]|nr:hypothetical protein [Leptolyngbya sp. SIOISBB]
MSWRKIGVLIVEEFRKRWFTKSSAPKTTLNTKVPDAMPSISLKSQAERDFIEFQRQRQQANPMSRRTRSWLFLGTFAFFLVVYASVFDLQGVLILVAALLLHEGGHVLAMKIFGYRDTAMLFIPFLGALATARKEDATLTEKVWISLAGPLPGLALGIGLAIALNLSGMAPVSWGEEAVSILVFLNLFNLLPIYPLDGGQVADLLLFSRNPQIGVVFKAIGTGLLILTGLLLGAPLLFAFAILISLSIPNSFRLAKLSNQLRRKFHSTLETSLTTTENTDALARQVFQRLQQPPYDTLTFDQKSTLLTGILERRQEEAAGWTTRVGLSCVYLVSLFVGLIGGIAAIILTPTASEATETELADDIELATLSARATTPHVCQADIALQTATVNENAAVMSDLQITLIGTLDTPEQAQAVWQTLQPQLKSNDSASLFGQTIFVSTFNTQTQEQVGAALDAAAATVLTEDLLAGRGTVVRMTAEAPNEQQATQVTEELSSFFTVSENFTHSEDAVSIGPLRAPWDPPTTEHPPEELVQQANARYTYAQLIAAQEDTYLQSLSPNFSWVKGIVGSMIGHDGWATSADQRWFAELYQAQRAAAQQLLDSREKRIDADTVALFLEELDLENQQMALGYAYVQEKHDEEAYTRSMEDLHQRLLNVQERLAERIGAYYFVREEDRENIEAYAEIPLSYSLYGEVAQSGLTVSIEELVSYQTQATLPAIAAYFCERQFSNVRYDLADY